MTFSGSALAEDVIFTKQKEKGRKTLLIWNSPGPAENTEQENEQDRIVTDRPHFSEASSLVGLGVTQIETGYSFFFDKEDDVTTRTHSFPEPLLRVGIFAEWFEFRLGYNYLVQSINQPGQGTRSFSGSDDLYLAAKLALAEQAGIFPEVAFFPQMRLPTGSPAFTSREVLPGFNLAYSWVITDLIELECNTQLNRRLDGSDHFFSQFIQTANIEYNLGAKWGGFTEWFCFVPSGSLSELPQHYFHGGFVYFPTPNIQLDIHSAVGLTPASDDLAFTGAGFSMRF
jgi:hypothetical protein